MDGESVNFYLILFVFLAGGVVVFFAARFLAKSREIVDDPLLPDQLHFIYDYWRDKMRRILKE